MRLGLSLKRKNPDAQIEVVGTLAQAFTKVAQQEVDVAIGVRSCFLNLFRIKNDTHIAKHSFAKSFGFSDAKALFRRILK